MKHERTPPQPMLRGVQHAVGPYALQHDERKLVIQPNHDPPRSIGSLDPKPPSLHKSNSSIHRYNVIPEALPTPPPGTHPSLPHSPFGSVNTSSTHLPPPGSQLPLPGPSSIIPPSARSPLDELRALLPPAKHVTKYCDIYHNTFQTLHPVDVGIPHMQELSFQYIHNSMADRMLSSLEAKDISGFRDDVLRVALLCAGIAAGIQISDLEDASRKALLRQYVAQTMKLLRFADAQATCPIAAYPVGLIVAQVVQDELEPILAWSVLGSFKRLAQMYSTVGILSEPYPEDTRHLRSVENLQRVRQRQESFLAIVLGLNQFLDRTPFPDTRTWNNATYLQCLDVLAAVAAYCGSEAINREEDLVQHTDAMRAIQPVDKFALPHLADKSNCRNVHELLEYCTLRIHERLVNIHYCQIIMAACRRLPHHQDEFFSTGEICQAKARECIDTYLEMLGFSIIPLRSWILTVAALRSALILGASLAEGDLTVTDIAPDRERLSRLVNAFTTIHDETHADRSRWYRRYRLVFDMLQRMCELAGKHADGRPAVSNGASDSVAEKGTALRWMTRDERDDIMMPTRMVRAYLAAPSSDEYFLSSSLMSHQILLEI